VDQGDPLTRGMTMTYTNFRWLNESYESFPAGPA
jgi:hypothetical protein